MQVLGLTFWGCEYLLVSIIGSSTVLTRRHARSQLSWLGMRQRRHITYTKHCVWMGFSTGRWYMLAICLWRHILNCIRKHGYILSTSMKLWISCLQRSADVFRFVVVIFFHFNFSRNWSAESPDRCVAPPDPPVWACWGRPRGGYHPCGYCWCLLNDGVRIISSLDKFISSLDKVDVKFGQSLDQV